MFNKGIWSAKRVYFMDIFMIFNVYGLLTLGLISMLIYNIPFLLYYFFVKEIMNKSGKITLRFRFR